MADVQRSRWLTEPFIMATPEQFARFRDWLIASEYTEAGLGAAAGIDTVYALEPLSAERKVFREPADKLSVLVHLFLDAVRLPWTTVERFLTSADRAVIDPLGLLQPAAADPSLCYATVALYPIDGLYFASDRHGGWETSGASMPEDVVFSALTPLTHEFMALMPRIPCGDYLELCAGTGIAALIAADEFAEHAWAIDITERSTRFASFNAQLNGLTNVTALEGDLYEPVLGKSFDLITAHPPYVPSFDNVMVYRDAGEDGEQITRRIIEGLPRYLRPGGRFFCSCMLTDRRGASVERRIREMLGEHEADFDVVVAQSSSLEPALRFAASVQEGESSAELFARRLVAFEHLGIESFVTGLILIQRRRTMRAVGTRRRIFTAATTAADLQWLLGFVADSAGWSAADMRHLLDVKPRCLPWTELHSRSILRDGAWGVTGAQLVSAAPFAMKADCPAWFPTFLTWCDGTSTVRELYHRLLDQDLIGSAGSENDFANLVYTLADAPFVELSSAPLPVNPTVRGKPAPARTKGKSIA